MTPISLVSRYLPLLWIAIVFPISTGALRAETSSADRTNVLFIAVDDMKPLLGCYGDSNAITPSMDRLAAGGMVFTGAHCQWPVCGPSRASLMSSLRPEANGVINLKTDIRAKNPNVLTLPQHFRNNGYSTSGAGKIYDPRCVDNKKTLDAPSWSVPFVPIRHGELKHNGSKQFVMAAEVEDTELVDGQIAQSGIKLLKQASKSDQPFFVAVGFKKPHLPFIAPKKYWDLYDRDQFDLAGHQDGIEDASGYTIHNSPEFRGYEGVPKSGPMPESLQREAIHGYYACISYVDAQVGLLLDELDRLGLTQKTHIVLWGDHGFHLGDHAMWGKHSTLQQATHVPLIIKPCTGVAADNTKTPVEFTDIFPTLCDLTGLPVPSEINGRSLAGVLSGKVKQVRDGAMTVFKSRGSYGYSYRTERYRLTLWINKSGKIAATELYDYEVDPSEKQNVAGKPAYADIQATLAKQMQADAQGCDRLLQAQ